LNPFFEQVALGQHDRDASESEKQIIEIEEVFIHPKYEKPGLALVYFSGPEV
jgi:hypothetical protein